MKLLAYPNLWRGCIAAYCPSVQRFPSSQLIDYSANNKHGTLTNMDVASDWVASGSKIALDFDGSNDLVTVPSMTLGESFSISVWFLARTTGGGTFGRVIAGGSDTTPAAINISSNLITLQFQVNGTAQTVGVPSMSTKLSHYCCVFASGVRKEVWVDGILVGSTTQTATASAATMIIGNRAAADRAFDGIIDDVRFYGRALAPAEIATLALRRGIAYETKRIRRFRSAPVTSNRRRRLITGISA